MTRTSRVLAVFLLVFLGMASFGQQSTSMSATTIPVGGYAVTVVGADNSTDAKIVILGIGQCAVGATVQASFHLQYWDGAGSRSWVESHQPKQGGSSHIVTQPASAGVVADISLPRHGIYALSVDSFYEQGGSCGNRVLNPHFRFFAGGSPSDGDNYQFPQDFVESILDLRTGFGTLIVPTMSPTSLVFAMPTTAPRGNAYHYILYQQDENGNFVANASQGVAGGYSCKAVTVTSQPVLTGGLRAYRPTYALVVGWDGHSLSQLISVPFNRTDGDMVCRDDSGQETAISYTESLRRQITAGQRPFGFWPNRNR